MAATRADDLDLDFLIARIVRHCVNLRIASIRRKTRAAAQTVLIHTCIPHPDPPSMHDYEASGPTSRVYFSQRLRLHYVD